MNLILKLKTEFAKNKSLSAMRKNLVRCVNDCREFGKTRPESYERGVYKGMEEAWQNCVDMIDRKEPEMKKLVQDRISAVEGMQITASDPFIKGQMEGLYGAYCCVFEELDLIEPSVEIVGRA